MSNIWSGFTSCLATPHLFPQDRLSSLRVTAKLLPRPGSNVHVKFWTREQGKSISEGQKSGEPWEDLLCLCERWDESTLNAQRGCTSKNNTHMLLSFSFSRASQSSVGSGCAVSRVRQLWKQNVSQHPGYTTRWQHGWEEMLVKHDGAVSVPAVFLSKPSRGTGAAGEASSSFCTTKQQSLHLCFRNDMYQYRFYGTITFQWQRSNVTRGPYQPNWIDLN